MNTKGLLQNRALIRVYIVNMAVYVLKYPHNQQVPSHSILNI